jgi:O-antigen ligase
LKILYAKKKVLYGLIFIGLMTVTASAFVVNKNLGERFFYTQSKASGKSYFELLKSWEARVVIWDCGVNILSSQTPILIGNGFYGTKDKLLECYKTTIDRKEKRDYFVSKGFNPHNTFLDFLLSYGIIAFSLFVILMGLLFKRVRFSYTQTALYVSLVCFSLIESYFQRQLGGYYFGFIFILLLFKEYLPKNK